MLIVIRVNVWDITDEEIFIYLKCGQSLCWFYVANPSVKFLKSFVSSLSASLNECYTVLLLPYNHSCVGIVCVVRLHMIH